MVEEGGRDYLLVGAYDHNLHRIDALTGKVVWQSPWDDVIKGTNTVFANPHPTSDEDRIIVVAGSRRGSKYKVGDPRIAPFKAVSFATGRELWRFPIPKTPQYSQDVDSSSLLVDDTLYVPVESGYVYGLDPNATETWLSWRKPRVKYQSPPLWTAADVKAHPDIGGANIAIEASPSRIGDRLYISSANSNVRRSAQTAIWRIGEALVRLLAPILTFTSEEIWQYLPKIAGREESVHVALFTQAEDILGSGVSVSDEKQDHDWTALRSVRDQVID